jgi:REP element-mobilizing transposase RayT
MAVCAPEHRRRRPIRLHGYDYSLPGAYFVTNCTVGRDCLFGDMIGGAMRLNAAGEVVAAVWHKIPNHCRQVTLDEFVVMPNHVHGIVIINTPDSPLAAPQTAPQPGYRPPPG